MRQFEMHPHNPPPHELKSGNLPDHYADILIQRKDQLFAMSKYFVADACFSKHRLLSKLCDNGFVAVSRLCEDGDL
jgi:hypothetical protein